MKYCNSELEGARRDRFNEKDSEELLYNVRQSIEKSIQKLRDAAIYGAESDS